MARNDQRRRRVVIDEALQSRADLNEDRVEVSLPTASGTAIDAADYDRFAARRHQPRTTDFIPKRIGSVSLLAGGLLLAIGLLNGLRWSANHIADSLGPEFLSRFQLNQPGSLSKWFSSLLLIISCLTSLQIYALRQHRRNDYLGTYRVWLLFAAVMLAASMNCVVDFQGLLLQTENPTAGWLTWILVSFNAIALSALLVRGAIEVRACRAALTSIVIVCLIFVLTQTIHVKEIRLSLGEFGDLAYGNAVLFANVGVFLTTVLYGRYVFLISNGLLVVPVTAPKPKVSKAKPKKQNSEAVGKPTKAAKPKLPEESDEQEEVEKDVHEPEPLKTSVAPTKQLTLGNRFSEPKGKTPITGPLAFKMKKNITPDPVDENDIDEPDDDSNRHLSKSERRRLRKQQQNRRAA